MKKIFLLLTFGLLVWTSFAGYTWDDDYNKVYTQNEDKVIDTQGLDDPINAWTKSTVEEVEWIANANVSDEDNKQTSMINYVSNWINYFLWLLGLIVTIFIIKDGIIIITSAWDENKKKEAMTNLRNYILAIILIWVAYMIVNLIFYFINVNSQ